MKHLWLGCFSIACMFSQPLFAQTTSLYTTGFEPATFSPGPLAGQEGFLAYTGKNPAGAKVVNTRAASGLSSVQIKGSSLAPYSSEASPRYAAYYRRNFSFNPLAAGKPRVIAKADAAFVPNGTTVPTLGGLELYASTGDLLAGVTLSEDGTLTAFNDDAGPGTEVTGTASLDTFHTLALAADYSARQTEFYLDGDRIGTIPFTSGTTADLGDFDLFYNASEAPNADVFFDNYSVEAASAGTTLVTGRVNLEGLLKPAGRTVSFLFRPASGTAFTLTPALTANGTFTLGGIPAGTYSVLAAYPRHLKRAFSLTANGTSVSNLHLTLFAGDVDGNNTVDVDDLTALLRVYNSTAGDGTYFPAADLDENNQINVDDLTLLLNNYNRTGDRIGLKRDPRR